MGEPGTLMVIALRQERAVSIAIVLIHDGRDILAAGDDRARRGTDRESRTEPSVEVTTAECLLERGKGGLARAVARGNVRYLERVVHGRDNLRDVRVLRDDQVEPTGDEVNARVDRGRGFDDLVDARVGAADDDHHPVGRV